MVKGSKANATAKGQVLKEDERVEGIALTFLPPLAITLTCTCLRIASALKVSPPIALAISSPFLVALAISPPLPVALAISPPFSRRTRYLPPSPRRARYLSRELVSIPHFQSPSVPVDLRSDRLRDLMSSPLPSPSHFASPSVPIVFAIGSHIPSPSRLFRHLPSVLIALTISLTIPSQCKSPLPSHRPHDLTSHSLTISLMEDEASLPFVIVSSHPLPVASLSPIPFRRPHLLPYLPVFLVFSNALRHPSSLPCHPVASSGPKSKAAHC
ncbi:unnamed protein product [Closterium sp. NIES-64]|nr:unnamed protein product [Closterium sp. NIES-64]